MSEGKPENQPEFENPIDAVNRQGGPAFPVSVPGCGDNGWHGMSLRDYFAGQAPINYEIAIAAAYGSGSVPVLHNDQNRASFMAVWTALRYEYADAMLAARAALSKAGAKDE